MVALSDGIVSATLEVYGKVVREMLPTPSRPHYTFNLRDIGKVAQVTTIMFFVANDHPIMYFTLAGIRAVEIVLTS